MIVMVRVLPGAFIPVHVLASTQMEACAKAIVTLESMGAQFERVPVTSVVTFEQNPSHVQYRRLLDVEAAALGL